MTKHHDQTYCPKCSRMYCPGYWGEGVCTADMHFCGEPTADFDEAGRCLRVYYEANRETFWERCHHNPKGRRWEGPWADEVMLGIINEVARIHAERDRQYSAGLKVQK